MFVATFVTTIDACGTPAPVSSRTSPVRVAVSCWAWSAPGASSSPTSRTDADRQLLLDMIHFLAPDRPRPSKLFWLAVTLRPGSAARQLGARPANARDGLLKRSFGPQEYGRCFSQV